jgi:Tfp pilus assembly protein PilF
VKKSIDLKMAALAAALMLLAACSSAPSQDAETGSASTGKSAEVTTAARAEFDAGIAAMKAGQWPEAERQLAQVIRTQPNLSGAYLNLALVYVQTKRPAADVDTQFKKAVEVNPANVSACNQYGIWLRTQGRFKDAEAVYFKALQANAAYADTHLNLGILYDLYLGNPAQALTHYEKYLALKGEAADTGRVKSWVADLQRRSKG